MTEVQAENALRFSHNYNNMLNCPFFMTVRGADQARFALGSRHVVYHREEYKGIAEVVHSKRIKGKQLDTVICRMAFGKSVVSVKHILKRIYDIHDVNEMWVSVVIFKYLDKEK